jgi:hypothetical protein
MNLSTNRFSTIRGTFPFKAVEETYGENNLNLTVARSYIKKLLENAKVVWFLNSHHSEIFSEFEAIAAAERLYLLVCARNGQRSSESERPRRGQQTAKNCLKSHNKAFCFRIYDVCFIMHLIVAFFVDFVSHIADYLSCG